MLWWLNVLEWWLSFNRIYKKRGCASVGISYSHPSNTKNNVSRSNLRSPYFRESSLRSQWIDHGQKNKRLHKQKIKDQNQEWTLSGAVTWRRLEVLLWTLQKVSKVLPRMRGGRVKTATQRSWVLLARGYLIKGHDVTAIKMVMTSLKLYLTLIAR